MPALTNFHYSTQQSQRQSQTVKQARQTDNNKRHVRIVTREKEPSSSEKQTIKGEEEEIEHWNGKNIKPTQKQTYQQTESPV